MDRAEYAAWRRENHPEGLTCEFDDNALYAKGLCWKHYKRWNQYGFVIGPPRPRGQLASLATCVRCNEPFTRRKKPSTNRDKTLCRTCIWFRECRKCGIEFDATDTSYQFCPDCRFDDFSDYYTWWAQNNRAYFRNRSALRRAITQGAEAEDFTHEEIFNRDNWTCGICGDPVDPEAEWPDSNSPSLDHIIPLDLNGPHTRDNVRLAHLGCNCARGPARGEQLILLTTAT